MVNGGGGKLNLELRKVGKGENGPKTAVFDNETHENHEILAKNRSKWPFEAEKGQFS